MEIKIEEIGSEVEAGAQIGAPSGEQAQAEVSTLQAVASFESYKNADGSYDMERVWKDLTAERERADGLRKKLTDSAAKKPESFNAADLSIDIPEEERAAMDDLVTSFNEYGISKDQTEKILAKFAALLPTDEQQAKEAEVRYQEELKKLGAEQGKIVADLRSFTDSMVENKIWDDAQKKMFYDSVTSADVARMFHSAIQNFNVLRAGNFASVAPTHPPAPHQYSLQDRTDMYRKAFELMKINKLDGETELSRLDKLFAMK